MLTKKENEQLYNSKAIVQKWQGLGGERYNIHMSLTLGELLALRNAVKDGSTSAVRQDVLAFINNALSRAGIDY